MADDFTSVRQENWLSTAVRCCVYLHVWQRGFLIAVTHLIMIYGWKRTKYHQTYTLKYLQYKIEMVSKTLLIHTGVILSLCERLICAGTDRHIERALRNMLLIKHDWNLIVTCKTTNSVNRSINVPFSSSENHQSICWCWMYMYIIYIYKV